MFIIYNLIFLLFSIIYLPIYLFKGKFHRGFSRRFGVLPGNLNLGRPIWIHAVSVGEVIVIKGLLEELRKVCPNKKFVISTVTATANKIARNIAKNTDFVTYLPLDLSFIVKSVIDRINPSMFIIAETEIWPNLINCLYKKNIPIVVVNGRISDSSFKGYLMIKFLLKPILNRIYLCCVQTEIDSLRLLSLGADKDRVCVTGNMKFDYADFKKDPADYRAKLGLRPQDKLLVAGSTHPQEEEIILGAYQKLLREFPDLRLLIAPRHPERSADIERLIAKYDFKPLRISQIGLQLKTQHSQPVFILDTIGQLVSFYAIADIVFVGGSLIKKGGHNILEPARLEKPILLGPYMFNFRDIADLFLKNKAGILVHNQQELKDKVKDLLNNPSIARQMVNKAKDLVVKNRGATTRNLNLIKEIYAKSSL